MNEALIGVIIGGLISWVAPLLTLRYSQKRWHLELKVSHLRSERNRAEAMYERILSSFSKGAVKNSYSSNMVSDILVLCPAEVGDIFTNFMKENEKTEELCKHTYLKLAAAMKQDLRHRDSEIEKLLSEK